MNLIDLDARAIGLVKDILARQLPEFDVYVFGSRVRGTARNTSDLDLAVMSDRPVGAARLADLREAFSDSDLPFKVDIVDWAATQNNFRELIQKEFVRIQTGKKS